MKIVGRRLKEFINVEDLEEENGSILASFRNIEKLKVESLEHFRPSEIRN